MSSAWMISTRSRASNPSSFSAGFITPPDPIADCRLCPCFIDTTNRHAKLKNCIALPSPKPQLLSPIPRLAQECAHDLHIAVELVAADAMPGSGDPRHTQLRHQRPQRRRALVGDNRPQGRVGG